jgi:hypothetical protein
VNGKLTVVRYLKDELKTGTFHGMLKQLDIEENDLYKLEERSCESTNIRLSLRLPRKAAG